MIDKDDLRRDSLREGLKVKGRSRREAAARGAEAEKGSRPRRNDILPLLPSDLGWIAPPVCPDLIYDRHSPPREFDFQRQ
jgi:hypothetical protein